MMELPPTVMMIHLPSLSHPPPKDVSATEAHFNIVIIFFSLAFLECSRLPSTIKTVTQSHLCLMVLKKRNLFEIVNYVIPKAFTNKPFPDMS